MKKIGLFYAAKAEKTSWVAERIQKEFGESHIKVVPIEQAWQNDFAAYDCFIVGASTWFDGELPTYWDELLPELRTMDLKGKKVAIFGLGDQVRTMVQKAEIPLADVIRMISETPARIMGVLDRKGTLERGKDADIIALDKDLNVRAVWAMGQLVEGINKLF